MQTCFEEMFEKPPKKKYNKYKEVQEFEINANFLFSRKLATIGHTYLSEKPDKNHAIGSEIICLKPEFFG